MSQKTLKIQRFVAYSIHNNLKAVPPKDYPTTGELKSTISVVLPALKEPSLEYINMLKKAEDLSERMAKKEVSEEESKAVVDGINTSWKEYHREHSRDLVEIVLDDEGFKVLKAQFDREGWGKKWAASLEEFESLLEAFTEAAK